MIGGTLLWALIGLCILAGVLDRVRDELRKKQDPYWRAYRGNE